jgi:glycosyltransferase involved in cell wall biosynthesis
VPCRNEAKAINAFLNSLLHQELGDLRWEAIIADGMSADGTRKILQQFSKEHPQIRIINNPSRIASTGLNTCIRAAAGEIIVRMDVHTEYKPDYVRRCVEVLLRTNAANVGGACVAVQTGYVGRAIAAAFHSRVAVGGARWHQPTYEGPVDTVHLGCWRREVLERIGYFDETLVRNQDDELNLRLTRAGGTIWQSPDIVSWYHPRSSLGALFRQYFQYGFWKVAVIRKHRVPASWRHLVPGAFVLGNIALLAAVILGAIFGRGPFPWFTDAGFGLDITRLYKGMKINYALRTDKIWEGIDQLMDISWSF